MNDKKDLHNLESIIASNYRDNEFCTTKLAEILDISCSYLREIWYRKYCICPQQYIEKVRLEYFIRIYSPDLPLYEMSESAGFIDVRSLRRAFKKHFKFTPSTLCELYKNNQTDLQLFMQGLIHRLWNNGKLTSDY